MPTGPHDDTESIDAAFQPALESEECDIQLFWFVLF